MERNQELHSNVQVRTRTYHVSHSKKLLLDPDLFRPSFYTFLCLLVSSKAAQFKKNRESQRNLEDAAPKQDDEEDEIDE